MKEEILEVVKKYQEVVHSQDKTLFDEIFADQADCELISITTEYKGKEAIYNDFLVGGIQKAYSVIDLINDGIDINLVNDKMAIVVFKYHTECIRRENNEAYGIQGLETQVQIKENGKWKIVHVHYSK